METDRKLVPTEPRAGATKGRDIELDFLRGVAILLVIDFHSSASILDPILKPRGWANIGWAGVNVFFVLSGFLVGGLLMKEWKTRSRIDGARFLIRRAFKIWPQYYIYVFATIAFSTMTLRYAWAQLLNVQNYHPAILHTWSLAVEEHVYLLLVVLFLAAAYWRLRIRTLAIVLSATCVVEIVLRYILIRHHQDVYMGTHTRLDGILYGVLLALMYHFAPQHFERLRSMRKALTVCFAVGFPGLFIAGLGPYEPALRIDAANLCSVALLLLLYTTPLPGTNAPRRKHGLAYRAVAWIGLYSYGIYLWHVNALASVQRFAAHHHLWAPVVELLGAVAAIAAGAVTTRLIEFPALALRDRLFPRRVDSPVGPPAIVEAPEPEAALA